VRITRAWLLLAVALVLPGCGGGPEYGEVEGVVTRNGTPLPEIEVFFLPDPAEGTRGPEATGTTDDQGRYRLRLRRTVGDGILVGRHYVCLLDLRLGPNGPPDKGRVPEYHSPSVTPLQRVEVKPGRQTLNFDLK
jgi:hypothetical protein